MKNILTGIWWLILITSIYIAIIYNIFKTELVIKNNNGDLLTIIDFICLNKFLIIPILFYLVTLILGLVVLIHEKKEKTNQEK